MKVPVVVKEVSPKVKQVGPRRMVVHLRIERECYHVLEERAAALGCPLDDLLDDYIHILAYGKFILSSIQDDRMAGMLYYVRKHYNDVYMEVLHAVPYPPSEEVSENG